MKQEVESQTEDLKLKTLEAQEASAAAIEAKETAEQAQEEANALRQEAEAHAEELEILDQQKTAFFQNMSHELRTPLTLILNPLENQSREQPDNTELSVATKNSRRLLRLVNQLLDFQNSKRKKGTRAGSTRYPSVHACLRRLFSLRLFDQGHCVQSRARWCALQEDDLPMHVMGEVDALEKVAFNYLSNALKYTPKDGSIALGWRHVTTKPGSTSKIPGQGYRREDKAKLFQVFSQVDETTTQTRRGPGPGSSLSPW